MVRFIVIGLSWAVVALAGCPRGDSTNMQTAKRSVVTLAPAGRAPVTVRVEVARTPEQTQRGLMFRERLDADAGMVFLFENDDDHTFWMKNTPLPLDMIFITRDLAVAGVVENTTPFSTQTRSCGQQSRYVLEVNAGFAAQHGITAGTKVTFVNVF